ncbi:scarecrow-like protein 14 [Malania oleifera]|uniref:scarecrow-like protein 14 n=1 Tax=Malania oleifera TaxID=397392 RepID=UPI0025AE80FF|nr:scarecrow-like protein 14 [Malania oleifera]
MGLSSLPPEQAPAYLAPTSTANPDVDSAGDDGFSDPVLQYIAQMLMEEDQDEEGSLLHDPAALRATEKSLYEAVGKKYPPSPAHPTTLGCPNNISPDCNVTTSNYSVSQSNTSEMKGGLSGSLEMHQPFLSTLNFWNTIGRGEYKLQFQRGQEEASKFLPRENLLLVNLENSNTKLTPKSSKDDDSPDASEDDRVYSSAVVRGKKNHQREDSDEERRRRKQLAVSGEEDELTEMLDNVFLFPAKENKNIVESLSGSSVGESLPVQNVEACGFNPGKGAKRTGNEESVDLKDYLVLCAQDIAAEDWRTAKERLEEIRLHSSPFGDGFQRCAHYFANALEARLAGTGTQIYAALSSKMPSAAAMLKAYRSFVSVCPFRRISFYFANHHILNLARKARAIHIIDFGILYGFQWPMVIQDLSTFVGGPPMLRVTGIEFPEPGFRPARKVGDTGRRLATYCKRFNVPFEYNAIAKKWETIQTIDLKIDKNEVVVVNCLFRLEAVCDESISLDCPRNVTLNLIQKINPNIFIHGVNNGYHNAPFFVTRFRETFSHYLSVFDMMDINFSRESQDRLIFEKEFYGMVMMNIIGCEGSMRFFRPETYKQWKIRNMRAGFKQLPLDTELMNTLKVKVKSDYHKDFLIDEDGQWMLQGWKGRVLTALSCWVSNDSLEHFLKTHNQ